jgi:hypothetical protein
MQEIATGPFAKAHELSAAEQNAIVAAIEREDIPTLEQFAERMQCAWFTLPEAMFAAEAALSLEKRDAALCLAQYGILPSAAFLAQKTQRDPKLVLSILQVAGPVWTFRRIMEASHIVPAEGAPSAIARLAEAGVDLDDYRYPRRPLLAAVSHGSTETVERMLEAGAPVSEDALALARRQGRQAVIDALEAARPSETQRRRPAA